MSRDLNLRQDIINRLIDDISSELLESPLPSLSTLAGLYNVSRTTIRHAVHYLTKQKILNKQNDQLVVIQKPTEDLKITYIKIKKLENNQIQKLEKYFSHAVQQKIIKPGDDFTELELAKKANVDIFTVREYLIQFSRFNLISHIAAGKWKLTKLTQHYADKLFELREMLECHALNCFMNLPKDDMRWKQMKFLLQEHRTLRDNIIEKYPDFSLLDQQLHSLILSAANNPFINDFINLISVVFHFHYQWDNKDLRTRNILAVEEHLAILVKIVSQDDLGAITELKRHLQTAKKGLMNSINRVNE
ncbi:GntR family transcriptional regulator [Bisgaard Taxon 10/6]|uniref:GntR family transcriptional regulator n=1 Tax=Exercitatus varius TaxID=67857 RepID=UPI00294B71E1|nr:GntR family transcriptional regulator [Exercitatus varius]MDG2918545.1 GntR family transcriptional regulator [Exercitatus varius]MDG2953089.1 GntR family transcriptional regulator [Exercitatus varius]